MKDILEQKGDVNKLKENNHYDKKGKIKFASVEYVNTLSGKYSMNMEMKLQQLRKSKTLTIIIFVTVVKNLSQKSKL